MTWYFLFVLVPMLNCAFASEPLDSITGDQSFVSQHGCLVETPDRKWISEMMSQAESAFDMDANVSIECKKDFELYKQHARNQTLWAIRMMESSEWPRIGLISGVNTHFGHWSECLRSAGPGMKGQYCLVQAKYNFALEDAEPTTPSWVDWPDENASAWKVIKMYETTRIRFSRQTLTWALCIPSSCKPFELESSVHNSLRPIFEASGFNVTVTVDAEKCHVREAPAFPRGYHYTRLSLAGLVALMVSATVYELVAISSGKKKKDVHDRLILKVFGCFSALQSYETLTRKSNRTYSVLYFLKTFSAGVNIVGHAFFFRAMFPNMNAELLEMSYKPWALELLFANIVTVFIVVSGFLTAFHFDFSPKNDIGILYFFLTILFRWLRMIPVLSSIILYMIFVLPYTNEGPLWKTFILSEAKYCSSNWWTNILALNNLIRRDGICFRTSWYITVDMQLSMIGVALLLVIKRHRKFGFALMIFTFLFSSMCTFLVIYWNQYDGARLYIAKEIFNCSGFLNVYVSTYYRLGPYLVGCATAMYTKWLMKTECKVSRIQIVCILTFLSVIGFGVQLYSYLFFMVGRPYYAFENATFGSLSGTLFALPVAGLICACFLSGSGIVTRVLEIKLFLLIGRLGYCMYLVSFLIQMADIASQKRVLLYAERSELYWIGFHDVVTSIMLAFLLFLILEGPICAMTKLLQAHLIRKNKLVSVERLSNGKMKSTHFENEEIKSTPQENGEMKNTRKQR